MRTKSNSITKRCVSTGSRNGFALVVAGSSIALVVVLLFARNSEVSDLGSDVPTERQAPAVRNNDEEVATAPTKVGPVPTEPSEAAPRTDVAESGELGAFGVPAPKSAQEIIFWMEGNGIKIPPDLVLDKPEAWDELQQIAEGTRRYVREARDNVMDLGREIANARLFNGQFERFLSDSKVDSADPKAKEKWPWMFRKGMAFRKVRHGFEDGKHVAKVVDIMPGESARLDEENARAESYLESMRLAIQDLIARRRVPPR